MPIPIYTHPSCRLHDAGRGHPESPARIVAVLDALAAEPTLAAVEAPAVDLALVRSVHEPAYVDMLEAYAERGGGVLDADTVMASHSWEAALHAAGGVVAAVDHALDGGGNAFVAARPPGHHALADRAMGFCLLANVVLGAAAARARGAERVLIVDWDVHHGNGTQALVEADPAIRFVSLHQWPWWPGTGAADERGVGNVFNVPRPGGLPPERYVDDLLEAVTAAVRHWPPDLVLVSAGFDAMRGDPLGGFTLEPGHYTLLTTRLRELAGRAPVVGVLEGGYIPARLAEGARAHALALT